MSYQIQKMRAKLHNGVVNEACLGYEGSVTIGEDLLIASGIEVGEKVQVLNISNGNRIETYVIEGAGRKIALNGAAARLFHTGDQVIIIAYAFVTRYTDEPSKQDFTPIRVILDGSMQNIVKDVLY
jgi:aspartate 1-decarboxylase